MTAREKEELREAIEDLDFHAFDLMQYALQLSELLESPKETPRADGGRPLKHVDAIWEDAAELIAEVQKSAKYCASDMSHLKSEIEYYIKNPTTSDDEASPEPPLIDGSKLTPEQKGIMPNVTPETMMKLNVILEALPGVKPHVRKDGVIEIA